MDEAAEEEEEVAVEVRQVNPRVTRLILRTSTSRVTCYRCGKEGHMRSDCPLN